MSHSHNHSSDGKLSFAVFINILLTIAQWQLEDERVFMEAHLVLNSDNQEAVKVQSRSILEETFNISHATLETRTVG